MKYIASVSFGKDNLAMLLRLIEEHKQIDEVIFYDTGMEFEAIYNNLRKIKKIIDVTVLRPNIQFLEKMLYKPVDNGEHYGYDWCGGSTRWGTSDKTRSIKKYLKEKYGEEKIFEYVGIAADEQNRIKDNSNKLYPLVEWGMTENDCLNYCYNHGYDWEEDGIELYSVLDRVSCWCCANKNLKELKNIYIYMPRYWNRLKGLQSRIKRPFKKNYSIFQLESKFKAEGNKI